MGKEIEALEHHADLAAQATQVAGPVGDGRPADGNFALLPLLQTVQAAQQSRLSGPGRAAEHCAAAGLHVQRNAVERTPRSEEHTSELQSLMRISYAVFCLKKKKQYKHI